ncbi:MAG: hypothetical protein WCY05_06595 [Candidatus Omnitrophota bacterium]
MEKLNVKIKGFNALLMHSNYGANPLSPISKEIKKIDRIPAKQKTDADFVRKLYLEWLSGIYHDDKEKLLEYVLEAQFNTEETRLEFGSQKLKGDNRVYVPSECIEATIIAGAKKERKGTAVKSSVIVSPEKIPLIFKDQNQDLFSLMKKDTYRDVRQAKIGRSTITRCRPRFDDWELEFEIEYDNEIVNEETITEALLYAGKYIGICDYRPKYGRFQIIDIGRVS